MKIEYKDYRLGWLHLSTVANLKKENYELHTHFKFPAQGQGKEQEGFYDCPERGSYFLRLGLRLLKTDYEIDWEGAGP